jgi:hypothetical protein
LQNSLAAAKTHTPTFSLQPDEQHSHRSQTLKRPQAHLTMDITSFIIQGRDKALLYGDYSTYHGQLSKRLLNSRRKLGTVTKNRGKFRKAEQATAEDIKTNNEYDITFCLPSLLPVRLIRRRGCSGADLILLRFLDMSTCFSLPASVPGRRQ